MPDETATRAPARRPLRRVRAVLLAVIGLLYVVSIPWYRSGESTGRLFGLPDWVGVALLCYLAVAVLNAVAWLLTEVPDSDSDESQSGGAP